MKSRLLEGRHAFGRSSRLAVSFGTVVQAAIHRRGSVAAQELLLRSMTPMSMSHETAGGVMTKLIDCEMSRWSEL